MIFLTFFHFDWKSLFSIFKEKKIDNVKSSTFFLMICLHYAFLKVHISNIWEVEDLIPFAIVQCPFHINQIVGYITYFFKWALVADISTNARTHFTTIKSFSKSILQALKVISNRNIFRRLCCIDCNTHKQEQQHAVISRKFNAIVMSNSGRNYCWVETYLVIVTIKHFLVLQK